MHRVCAQLGGLQLAEEATRDEFLGDGRELDGAAALREFGAEVWRQEFGFHAMAREHFGSFTSKMKPFGVSSHQRSMVQAFGIA
jgi:hypothetical protein